MEVKQIREEIAKIDSMLTVIDSEIASGLNRSESIDEDEKIIKQEYMCILNSLSGGTGTLLSGTGLNGSFSAFIGLDAFTYFGLIQAFSEDEIVMECLSEIFLSVQGVTMTQMEDFLILIEKMTNNNIKFKMSIALINKILIDLDINNVEKIEENKKINSKNIYGLIIGRCCEMLNNSYVDDNNTENNLFEINDFLINQIIENIKRSEWPLYIEIEIFFFLYFFSHKIENICSLNSIHRFNLKCIQ
jgi:hypothetical protein